MSEFTFLYRGSDPTNSPEQMQKTMQKWVAWFKDLSAKGHIKDPGHPLERSGKVVNGKHKSVRGLFPAPIEDYRRERAIFRVHAARGRAEDDFTTFFLDGHTAAIVKLS